MGCALLIGCSDVFRDLLPADTPAVDSDVDVEVDVVVVGPDAEHPMLLAQRAARAHPAAELVIIAAPSVFDELVTALRTSPYVPIGAEVVAAEDLESVRQALDNCLLRGRVRRQHKATLEHAQRALQRHPTVPPKQVAAHEEDRAGAAPALSVAQRANLRTFFEFFSPLAAGVSAELRDAALAMPAFEMLVNAESTEAFEKQGAARAILMRNAVVADEWPPYLASLAALGESYARFGLAFGDWFAIWNMFRTTISARLFAESTRGREEVEAILDGMNVWIDVAMAAIGSAYVAAHTSLWDQHLERQRVFSAVMQSTDDAVLTQTVSGVVTAWNAGAERLYGFTESEAVGTNMFHLIVPPDRRDEFHGLMEAMRAGESVQRLETVRVNKAGRRIDVALTVSPLLDGAGNLIGASGIARDITARKKAENEMRAREVRRTAMLDGALDAIITITHESVIVDFNPAAERIFGHRRDAVVGARLHDVIIPERLRAAHRAGMERYLRTRAPALLNDRIELTALREDGSEFLVEASIIHLAGTEPPLFTGFLRDITALKAAEAELKRLVEDLERSNAELEQFAYVASHDLQEPLRMVASYTQLLGKRYQGQLDERADKYIYYATDGAKRMQRLIRDLLSLSRVGKGGEPFEVIDLNEVAGAVERMFRRRISEVGAEVHLGSLPTVRGDRTQLTQLIQNLIANALKFVGDRVPHIRVDAERSGDQWVICVRDNGIGFDAKHGERIFRMFQRLHARDEYEGSGIGLALVRKIAERHRGRVWAEGNPGEGAAFFVAFPADE